MSSLPGVNGSTPTQLMDISGLDVETALMSVQATRANLLEDQLKTQLEDVKTRNANISNLNDALSAARTLLGSFPADSTSDTWIDSKKKAPENKEEANKQWEALKDKAAIAGVDLSSVNSRGKLEKLVENIKSSIDTESNSQQMEMLRLQSLSNKRNEAFDLMTNFVKKMQDSRSSIVGNMR